MPPESPQLNPEIAHVLALDAGSELDGYTHAALGLTGKVPSYSSDGRSALKILAALPTLWLVKANGRTVDLWNNAGKLPATFKFDPAKPFWAGTPSSMMVACADPCVALCKAAYLMRLEVK